RGVLLQGSAEIGKMQISQLGSNLHADLQNYTASATMRRLTLYASRGASNSNEFFFGPNSPFLQPGGSTGTTTLPSQIFLPFTYSDVASNHVGANWRSRGSLQLQAEYSNDKFDFASSTITQNTFGQASVIVQYKFGRFTLYGGY